jgi:hypothetical protein
MRRPRAARGRHRARTCARTARRTAALRCAVAAPELWPVLCAQAVRFRAWRSCSSRSCGRSKPSIQMREQRALSRLEMKSQARSPRANARRETAAAAQVDATEPDGARPPTKKEIAASDARNAAARGRVGPGGLGRCRKQTPHVAGTLPARLFPYGRPGRRDFRGRPGVTRATAVAGSSRTHRRRWPRPAATGYEVRGAGGKLLSRAASASVFGEWVDRRAEAGRIAPHVPRVAALPGAGHADPVAVHPLQARAPSSVFSCVWETQLDRPGRHRRRPCAAASAGAGRHRA